jgi:CheY-like chemotaxis protein
MPLVHLNCVLIDDSPECLELVHRSLTNSRLGVSPTKFLDAEEALEYLREHRVDFVVTDRRMPGMSGAEFIAEFRKFDQRTPVIMVSADASMVDDPLKDGADAFISKDAIAQRLCPLVEELFTTQVAAAHVTTRLKAS